MTRISISAIPPIGGLIVTVDDELGSEENAEERTIVGNRAAVYSQTGLFATGTVYLNIDGFGVAIRAEDREGRNLGESELKQLAITAAEVFLAQL